MTKRKLRGYVKPTLFMLSISVIAISVLYLSKNIPESNGVDKTYVMNAIIDDVTPVINYSVTSTKPFTDETVTIYSNYYDKDETEEQQQNSLLYYENTYLQNNGIVYSNDNEFDVVSVLDGTVIDVKEDEILNNVVYIAHENNLTTIYYGLKDITVKVNDKVSQGQVIGKSTNNKFCEKQNSLLFEVNIDGKTMNPEQFYQMDLSNME